MTKALTFEDLLIQMMDLGVDDRLVTSYDVPDILNVQGWNVEQVSRVWSVRPDTLYSSSWDTESLERLGGKQVLSNVWHHLKAKGKTGHPKRRAVDEGDVQAKRQRCEQEMVSGPSVSSVDKGTSVVVANDHPKAVPDMNCPEEDPSKASTSIVLPSPNDPIPRKLRKARRKSKACVKLTDWLIPSPAPSRADHKPPTSPAQTKRSSSVPCSKKRRMSKKNKREVLPQPFPQPDFEDSCSLPAPSSSDAPDRRFPAPRTPLQVKIKSLKPTPSFDGSPTLSSLPREQAPAAPGTRQGRLPSPKQKQEMDRQDGIQLKKKMMDGQHSDK